MCDSSSLINFARNFLFLTISLTFIFLVISHLFISHFEKKKILKSFLRKNNLFKVWCSHSPFWTYSFFDEQNISLFFNRRKHRELNSMKRRGYSPSFKLDRGEYPPNQLLDNVSTSTKKTFKNVFLIENNIKEFSIVYIPKEFTCLCHYTIQRGHFLSGEIYFDLRNITPIIDMRDDNLFVFTRVLSLFKILHNKKFKNKESEMVIIILISHLNNLRNNERERIEKDFSLVEEGKWKLLFPKIGFPNLDDEMLMLDINPRFASYYFLSKLKKLKFIGETFEKYILKECTLKRIAEEPYDSRIELDDEMFKIKK